MNNWKSLKNPVLSYGDWSIKDACMARRDGLWHLFFSAFDQERSTVVHVTTPDFQTFSPFHFQLDGRDAGWIGMCSPDLVYSQGRYVLVLNSWGEMEDRPNALFTMESADLFDWSKPRPLGHNLDPDARIIDGALAWTGDCWMCVLKWWNQARMATAPSLDGPWRWVSQERMALLAEDGEENGHVHENFQLVEIDRQWHLLSTDYIPSASKRDATLEGKPFQRGISGGNHTPWLYRMSGDPADPQAWLRWEDGRPLQVPGEAFNTIDRVNAAALCDNRKEDGFLYLIYGGKNAERRDEFAGTAAAGRPWPRGWNRLGLARSGDLVEWTVPGGP
ncbi:MAG: hypothetical protein ACP5I4_13520 [Oceanipulchritudo sp.]